MPTPHIRANAGDIAPSVLLPGDPLRAKMIAETFFTNPVLVNDIRGALAYTGTVDGVSVSVLGTGMGIPSASIYATELVTQYDVTQLIRVGSCGGIADDVALRDVIIALGAGTDSSVNRARYADMDFAAIASYRLVRAAADAATARNLSVKVGAVHTADLFYDPRPTRMATIASMGVLAVEMETAGLYGIAAQYGVEALALLTVSDHVMTGAETSPDERETGFTDMVALALDTVKATRG